MRKQKKEAIWEEDEYSYPMAFGFIPNIMAYIHEDGRTRAGMLIVPGGGYSIVSPTEGEIVAKKFYEKGFQTFVLTYTSNMLMTTPLKKQPMQDLSRAIRFIRKHAESYFVDPEKLVICGFSAGGHLSASICVHYRDVQDENNAYRDIPNRPDAAILCYPVITTGEHAHIGSFCALLGGQTNPQTGEFVCTASEEELNYMSLEKHVTPDTPPCFLWQTATDEVVPVENSYLFSESCRRNGVLHAYHVFSHGRHGLSLANEEWAEERFGELYTLEQTQRLIQAVKDGNVLMPKDAADALLNHFGDIENLSHQFATDLQPNEEVAAWPDLAELWLKYACKISSQDSFTAISQDSISDDNHEIL